MEQKELERSEKSVLLENILNSVPEEAVSSDVEEPNENGEDTLEDSDTEAAGDAEEPTDADEPSNVLKILRNMIMKSLTGKKMKTMRKYPKS